MRVIIITVILILFLNAMLVFGLMMANCSEGTMLIEDEEDQRHAILEWQDRKRKRMPGIMNSTNGHAVVRYGEHSENPENTEKRRGLFSPKE